MNPGVIHHVCAITQRGKELMGQTTINIVAVVEHDYQGRLSEIPGEDLDGEVPREIGQQLCWITLSDWADPQMKGEKGNRVYFMSSGGHARLRGLN